jgi:dipeptidyl aminopeptidase/acylaminoacyl peptidase
MRSSALVLAALLSSGPAAAPVRVLQPDDVFAIKAVDDPRLSPDGKAVAYTVTTLDRERDDADADVWLAPLDGSPALRLTTGAKSETAPRFSPDGKYLAFLSARDGKKVQVFLLDRRGGEAVQLTDFGADVSELAWSPDSSRLALVVHDEDADDPDLADEDAEGEDGPTPKPIVVQRRQFKRDGEGYLGALRDHLHVFEVAQRTSVQVTSGPYDDSEPAWSPDGRLLAFVSNRTPDPDANQNTDVFVVEPKAGARPRPVTRAAGADASPSFSPDGRLIAYEAGGDPADLWYGTNHVAVVPVAGGESVALTRALDRNVERPTFGPGGAFVYFLLEDGGDRHLARVAVQGGAVERVVAGERHVEAFDLGRGGEVVVLESSPLQPFEVAVVAAEGTLRRLTHVNDDFLAGVNLAPRERFRARSADGTMVDGFLTRPAPGSARGPQPAVLRIHGGPALQFSAEFNLEWQILAGHGYTVIAANPRGSSGYGRDFSRAIWADWGRKDYEDVMAAVDHAVAQGAADPDRLGVGGWSYGGILTNYVIVQSTRFRAAISGASEANYLSNYGTDHYQYEWEAELGLPWREVDRWVRLSPWFQVEKIVTPTLFLCGSGDMNVPLLNSEQLFQAMKRLGRETELVIYPGEAHDIDTPSYAKDRYERYLAWYDRFLRPQATSLRGPALFPPEVAPARRAVLEQNLAQARADYERDPEDADAVIWLGRRTAYLGRFREAIDIFTKGIEAHPEDVRLYRHRGHRYITVRELDKAVADLERAAAIIARKRLPDEVEPDGDPNPQNIPTSTLHFNVYYHLGLARFLKGDFAGAVTAYRECLKHSQGSPDRLVATSDWLYMALRRLGRKSEAQALLGPITGDLKVIENHAYWNRLLMYKGQKTPEELLGPRQDAVELATYGYGVGHWYLVNGQPARGREIFEKVVSGTQWPAFGYIAAEAELARR